MVKKKPTPLWKVFLFSISAIAVFLLTSTLFDLLQGDGSPGRTLTLTVCILVLISSVIVLGAHKIWQIIKNQLGW